MEARGGPAEMNKPARDHTWTPQAVVLLHWTKLQRHDFVQLWDVHNKMVPIWWFTAIVCSYRKVELFIMLKNIQVPYTEQDVVWELYHYCHINCLKSSDKLKEWYIYMDILEWIYMMNHKESDISVVSYCRCWYSCCIWCSSFSIVVRSSLVCLQHQSHLQHQSQYVCPFQLYPQYEHHPVSLYASPDKHAIPCQALGLLSPSTCLELWGQTRRLACLLGSTVVLPV